MTSLRLKGGQEVALRAHSKAVILRASPITHVPHSNLNRLRYYTQFLISLRVAFRNVACHAKFYALKF